MGRRKPRPEPPPIRSQLPRSELALSFRQQIESNQAKSIQLNESLKRVIIESVNLCREQGIILQEAKAVLDPDTFAEVTNGLGADAVRNYIKVSKKYRDEITDFATGLKTAFEISLLASGALPMPSGHGSQISHDPPGFFVWSSEFVMQFKFRFAKYLSCQPLDEWSKIDAEQFLFSLRPLLNVHRQITEWLRRQ